MAMLRASQGREADAKAKRSVRRAASGERELTEPQSFHDGRITLHSGDCRDVVKALPDASIDAIVCDPPYALESIRKRFGNAKAAPAKSGKTGAFTRASRGFMGQEWDTGEVAFDAAFWSDVCRVVKPGGYIFAFSGTRTYHRMAIAIEDGGFECRDQYAWTYSTGFPKSHPVAPGIASRLGPEAAEVGEWAGYGTAVKPAWEPIFVGRKPLCGTVAENVLAHGVGALNIDACRVGDEGGTTGKGSAAPSEGVYGDGLNGWSKEEVPGLGRFPTNVLHDGSHDVVAAFPTDADGKSASRFFYSAKAGEEDRLGFGHPTIKPVALMRWLVRHAVRRGGLILDPFAGTGTTGAAALYEGARAILVEREPAYQAMIARRMELAFAGPEEKRRALTKPEPQASAPLFGALA